MAFVPNSQARIFTRIPDEVTKVWERRVETTRNQVGTSFLDSGHYTTGVLRVKLIVEFDEPTSSADPFISEDHDKDTAIHFWQQTRRQWADLEGALDTTLSEFNKAAHNDALKRKDASFIVFRPGMTSFRDRSSQSRVPVTRKTTSVVDSIVPNDSASCVTLTQSEYENLKHKKTSKKKSKSNAPGSLLQYIART